MGRPAPEPLPRSEPDTKFKKCTGCGFFIDACHCTGGMLFRVGDIVVKLDDPTVRYRVEAAGEGWIDLHRIRKDGAIDRREYGFTSSPKRYRLIAGQARGTPDSYQC